MEHSPPLSLNNHTIISLQLGLPYISAEEYWSIRLAIPVSRISAVTKYWCLGGHKVMLKPNLDFLLFSSTGLGFVISALLLLICTQMQAGAGTKMVSVSQISCWYLVPGTRNLVSKCQAPAIFQSAARHVMGSWVPSALWHLGLGNV